MKTLVTLVGELIVAAALMAIPILTGLSFGLNWGVFRFIFFGFLS